MIMAIGERFRIGKGDGQRVTALNMDIPPTPHRLMDGSDTEVVLGLSANQLG